jgi:predicted branched-subunit amino acid permease
MNSASKEFFAGIRAELPIMFGVFPFGMIFGVLALDAGLTPWEAMAMAMMVLAGSSLMVAMPLVKAGTPYLIVIVTMAVVNLRHLLYSASIAPYLQHLRPAWKWLLGYLLTDEAYAVSVIHYQETERELIDLYKQAGQAKTVVMPVDQRHYFFLGAGLTLWVAWNLSSLMGILLGTVIPDGLSLGFALSLTFIALMVPSLKDRAGVAAALSAGLASLAAAGLPYRLGLLVGAVVGVCVGMLAEGKK